MRIPALGLAALSIALSGVLSAPARAAAPDMTLDNVQFAEPLLGDKVNVESLKGRVVLVEIWGIN
jgi:hypothetical protein